MPQLRHSRDDEPGYSRRRRGSGFVYVDPKGRAVTDERVLARIRSLAVPPAWRDVWICRSARGHLQATGADAAGRKQYRYHPAWREERDRAKHERVLRFASRLPKLRAAYRRNLRRNTPDRDRALATTVAILDRTSLRVGGEQYARSNGTYGLATIRSRHVTIEDDHVVIDFTGKSGIRHTATLTDPRIVHAVAEMDRLPGDEVFKYVGPTGCVVDVRSEDVNGYIKQHLGDEFSAKDFRTWSATVAAAVALDEAAAAGRSGRKAVVQVVREVAALLGNTPAVCRASYIDPRVVDLFLDGITISTGSDPPPRPRRGLSSQELLVLALLRTAPQTREPWAQERAKARRAGSSRASGALAA